MLLKYQQTDWSNPLPKNDRAADTQTCPRSHKGKERRADYLELSHGIKVFLTWAAFQLVKWDILGWRSDSTALTGFQSLWPAPRPLPLYKIPRFVGLSLHPLSGIPDPDLGLQTPLGCWHYDVPGRMLQMEFLGLSNWNLEEGVSALLTSACFPLCV